MLLSFQLRLIISPIIPQIIKWYCNQRHLFATEKHFTSIVKDQEGLRKLYIFNERCGYEKE